MKHFTLGAALLLAGAVACVPAPPGHVSIVYATQAPPPPRYEVVVVRPGPDYVWVPGYYSWTGVTYLWVGGRWDQPPRGHRHWQAGRWRHHGRHGWYWQPGRWK